MAEHKYLPNTRLLFVGLSNITYKSVVCLMSWDFNGSKTTVDASSFCGSSTLPGAATESITFTAQSLLGVSSAVQTSENNVFGHYNADTLIYWKAAKVTPIADDIIYEGQGYITSFTLGNPLNGVPTFGGTLSIDGAITKTVQA